MQQTSQNTALTVRLDVPIGPGGRSTVVGREQRVFCRMAAYQLREIGPGNAAIVADGDLGMFRFSILGVTLDVGGSKRGVGALRQHWQQRRHRRLHVADNTLRDGMTSSQMSRVNIDLHDL